MLDGEQEVPGTGDTPAETQTPDSTPDTSSPDPQPDNGAGQDDDND